MLLFVLLFENAIFRLPSSSIDPHITITSHNTKISIKEITPDMIIIFFFRICPNIISIIPIANKIHVV